MEKYIALDGNGNVHYLGKFENATEAENAADDMLFSWILVLNEIQASDMAQKINDKFNEG